DLARADSETEVQLEHAVGLQLAGKDHEAIPDFTRGPHCTQGVVLVDGREAEDDRRGGACHGLDRAAVPLHPNPGGIDGALSDAAERLGIDVLLLCRDDADVDEEGADRLPDLPVERLWRRLLVRDARLLVPGRRLSWRRSNIERRILVQDRLV